MHRYCKLVTQLQLQHTQDVALTSRKSDCCLQHNIHNIHSTALGLDLLSPRQRAQCRPTACRTPARRPPGIAAGDWMRTNEQTHQRTNQQTRPTAIHVIAIQQAKRIFTKLT